MKRLVCLLVLVVTVGMITNSVYAAEGNDIIWVGKKSYGCNLLDAGLAQWHFKGGTWLQTVGYSSLNGEDRGYNIRYLCNAKGAFYDDHWDIKPTKWCSDSEVKQTGIYGVEYVLIGPDGTNYGSVGAAAVDGCIKGIKKGGDAGKDATSPSDSVSLISETTSGGKPAAKPTTPKPSVGGSSASGAAGVRDACGEGYISFDGVQKAHHDEFLYTNEAAYKEAKSASDKGQDGVEVKSGLVYECDNRHCLGRSLKKMPAGHYFNGQRIDKAVEYRCVVGVDDKWEPVETKVSATCGESYISFDGQGADDDEFLYADNASYQAALNAKQLGQDGANLPGKVYECDNDHCKHETIREMAAGHVFEGKVVSEKRRYMCKAGFSGTDRWVLVTSLDDSKTASNMCQKYNLDKMEEKEIGCNEASIKYGKKCFVRCNSNGTTTFYVTECLYGEPFEQVPGGDVWKGKYLKCPSKPESNDGSKSGGSKSGGSQGGGSQDGGSQGGGSQGGGKAPVEEGFVCPADKLAQMVQWKQDCKDESAILSQISVVESVCNSTESEFNGAWMVLVGLNPDGCLNRAADEATKNVSKSIDTIKGLTSGLKQSAWKTEDGKFNTARLASDSIAGVVLGTAGGLITSSVVKKHQVKEGFEDIKCTIGGQNVADWSDEFSVGVK